MTSTKTIFVEGYGYQGRGWGGGGRGERGCKLENFKLAIEK